MGNPIVTKDAKGNATISTFDLEGRTLSTKSPLGSTNRFVYNAFGDLVEKIAPDQTSTAYEYDRAGRLIKVTDASHHTLHYGYDKASNMIYSVDAMGNISHYTYGAFGRKISWTDALGKSTTYQYDISGNMIGMTDRNGQELRYTYNDRGMMTNRKVQGTEVEIAYVYDVLGNRIEMTDGTGITTYTYDAYSRLVGVQASTGGSLSYGYDKNNNRIRMVGVDNKVTRYTYDVLGRLYQVIYDGATTTYGYDALGNRTSIELPNGVRTAYIFNEDSRITHIEQTNKSGGRISSYAYTYDVNGRETSKTDVYGKTTYRYDQVGRLKEVNAPGYVSVYAYDANGNRSQQQTSYMNLQGSGYQDGEGEEVSYRKEITYYTYDRNNRLIKTIVKMYNDVNAELVQKTTGYLYDDNGNETAQFTTYVKPHAMGLNQHMDSNVEGAEETDILIQRRVSQYDGFNRLIRIEDIRGGERQRITYVYNGADQRVKKTILSNQKAEMVTTRFTYDGAYLIHEASTAGKAISYVRGLTYVFKDEIMDTAQRSYYLQDEHGNVTYMVNEGGEVVNAYDYDAFGNAVFTLETGTSNAIRYTSEYQDPESGLYYLRARYYNPETGRFISEDSYRASKENPFRLNLYTYCHNDPINYVDPSGHWELGDEELSKSAQKRIKELTDAYFDTDDKNEQKKFHEEANAVRASEKNKKRSSRSNEDSFSRKINDKIKNSSKNDGRKNYIDGDTWKKVRQEEAAAVDVVNYIEKEVKTVGDYISDIKQYTDKFREKHKDIIKTANVLFGRYVDTMVGKSTKEPYPKIQESDRTLVTKEVVGETGVNIPYYWDISSILEGMNEVQTTLPWYQSDVLSYEMNLGKSDVYVPSVYEILTGPDSEEKSLILSLIPGLSDGKDIQEALTGYDYSAGRDLTVHERNVSVLAALIPFVGGKTIAKSADELTEVIYHGFKGTGETGIGLYKNVKGHHIHAKAAFKGHVAYDMNKGLSISQDFMKSRGWSHADMTTKQRQLFKELYNSGGANTLQEHSRIAIEALEAGGASFDEATDLVNQSIKNLIEQGTDSPTRIPWYSK